MTELDWDELDRLAAQAWPQKCACLRQLDATGAVVVDDKCEEHADGA